MNNSKGARLVPIVMFTNQPLDQKSPHHTYLPDISLKTGERSTNESEVKIKKKKP